MKQKTSRNLNFWVSAAVFQPELNNLQKCLKYVKKCHFWEGFSKFIQLWLKNSGWNKTNWVPYTLLIFSLQKLKVFTVVQIPLHFHCLFYSDPLHAVDHCTHFGLQLKPAFFANPLSHFLPFIYSQNYMFSTANLAFINCTFIKKWNQICQKNFQKFSKKISLICFFRQNDFLY